MCRAITESPLAHIRGLHTQHTRRRKITIEALTLTDTLNRRRHHIGKTPYRHQSPICIVGGEEVPVAHGCAVGGVGYVVGGQGEQIWGQEEFAWGKCCWWWLIVDTDLG